MQTDLTCQQIEHLKSTQATLLLFGGPQCGVCQAIRPKLERLLAQQYPEIEMVYVDCADSPDICAQHGVFSLPVVQLYIEGHVYLERGRSFSLLELDAEIERIYRLWKAQA
jgi:thioredoxin-like negative regulator of GroEL